MDNMSINGMFFVNALSYGYLAILIILRLVSVQHTSAVYLEYRWS
ncbi:protein of unknown function [Vibrio tapetis subsp. tapetis]|uniref:Uncharacterized protein n=1 Tax=Vibrio tapetis subsp. tapetis TaxID=1671868 RepID=A0A2N8ZBP0_9VIBR|nr:protein of unknown function [Vibrio tapetis subsp. tapetis]